MLTVTERIVKQPGIQGGDACIRDSRLPVWVLVRLQQLGLSDDRIFEAYPQLSHDDLMAAWEYAAAHADEIEEIIKENEADDPSAG